MITVKQELMATPLSQTAVTLLFAAPRPDPARTRKTRMACALARWVNREEDYHVIICHDGVALNYHREGLRIWPLIPFIETCGDRLATGFRIPVPKPIPIWPCEMLIHEPIRALPMILSYVTKGITEQSPSCLTLAMLMLEVGGVYVPPTVTTARLFKEFLLASGYEHARID